MSPGRMVPSLCFAGFGCESAIAEEFGLSVPQDLSVAGFYNVPEAANAVPALTTLAQPLHQMGAEAVRLLLELLKGEAKEEHLRFNASLVTRASTAPPRARQ